MREPYAAQREARTMIGVGLTMEGIGPNAVRRGYSTGPHATTLHRPDATCCNMLQHVATCNMQPTIKRNGPNFRVASPHHRIHVAISPPLPSDWQPAVGTRSCFTRWCWTTFGRRKSDRSQPM